MENKNLISERFIQAFNRLVEDNVVADKKSFAIKLGISSSMVTEIVKGRSNVGIAAIQKIVSEYRVSPNWLITGNGSMFDTYMEESPKPVVNHNYLPDSIPLIPFHAMAGILSGEQTAMDYECERYVVPAFRKADYLIQITGDSMLPTYKSGDIVACQRVAMGHFFQWNEVYVLDTEQGVIIKRIKRGSDIEHLLIISDNPDYDPFELHHSEVYHMAIVQGIIRLN